MSYVFSIGSMLFTLMSFLSEGPVALTSLVIAVLLVCTAALLAEMSKGRELHEKSNP